MIVRLAHHFMINSNVYKRTYNERPEYEKQYIAKHPHSGRVSKVVEAV